MDYGESSSTSYNLVSVKYKCIKCDKTYSKLSSPSGSITCEVWSQRFWERIVPQLSKASSTPVPKKKRTIKKENVRREKKGDENGSYNLTFGRDSHSHNRTDINDRDLSNTYGDARRNSRGNTRASNLHEEEKTPNQSRNLHNGRMPQHSSGSQYENVDESPYSYSFSNSGTRVPFSRESSSRHSNMNTPGQQRDSNPNSNNFSKQYFIV